MVSFKNSKSKYFLNLLSDTNVLIFVLLFIGLALRIYMAHVDPFLHEWDEKYHALVARNMMSNPFKPMLYSNPIINGDSWSFAHVWLHKQPLFMWQMAASMKLFGVSEFAMRLPSVLMGTTMIGMLYRMSILLFQNKATALLAALLLCCSNYQLNLISGREGMDHNDIAFGFYVLGSLWFYLEYLKTPKLKWVLLIGIFAGAAVLNKWLTGLLVFLPWGINSLVLYFKENDRKSLLQLLFSLLVTILIFLPWQLYILYVFPEIARAEFAYNSKHIFEAVEGHKGDIWYYVNNFKTYFGHNLQYLPIAGLVLFFINKKMTVQQKTAVIIPILAVFIFFSFIAQTKIKAYFFVVAPVAMIGIAYLLASIISKTGKAQVYLYIIVAAFVGSWSFDFTQIDNYNKELNYRPSKIYNATIYRRLGDIVPAGIHIITNVNAFEHADVMFYNPRFSAYHYYFSEVEMKNFEANKTPIAAFEDHNGYPLPSYIRNYPYLFIIHEKLKS